jgi:predicted dehydrogenase
MKREIKKALTKQIRYAVIGLGHIAQTAVLPAFKHAKKNSRLQAIVSSDPEKLDKIGSQYDVQDRLSYEDLEHYLASGAVDAVYIATPNDQHEYYILLAAKAGVHVLCEKPLSYDENSCWAILDAINSYNIRLMTAYRLHFDPANLKVIEMARKGQLGNLRIFNSVFTMQVHDRNNIRLSGDRCGGPLHDIGIYCINAARYLFGAEPINAFATGIRSELTRFSEVDEGLAAILRFPQGRLATFTISFGASSASDFELIGTKAKLRLENAYEYAEPMRLVFTKEDAKPEITKFKKHDQFGPELLYFSDCLLKGREPEPSAIEGLIDLSIIDALLASKQSGKLVSLSLGLHKKHRPTSTQAMMRPAVKAPQQIHARSPH